MTKQEYKDLRIKELGKNYRKHTTSKSDSDKCISMECGDWPIFRGITSAEMTLKMLLECKYTNEQMIIKLNVKFPNNNNNSSRPHRIFNIFSNGKCKNVQKYDKGNILGLVWDRYKLFTKDGKFKVDFEKLGRNLITENQYYKELETEINKSKLDGLKTIENRLIKAPKFPEKIEARTTLYKRNPDVIVYVKDRAKGICENCKKDAPFIRLSDSTPYLEIHHKIPLSMGGEDTVQNSLALCPNCHREMHYGKQ